MNDSAAPLFQLVYVSNVAPEAARDLATAMREVLLVSHRRNAQDDITGLLLSNGVWFVQILEGEEGAVRACYARIEADPRHVSPTVRLLRPVDEREYGRWSMCGVTLSAAEDELLGGQDLGLDIRQLASGALTQMLRRVAGVHSEELDLLHKELGAEVSSAPMWKTGA